MNQTTQFGGISEGDLVSILAATDKVLAQLGGKVSVGHSHGVPLHCRLLLDVHSGNAGPRLTKLIRVGPESSLHHYLLQYMVAGGKRYYLFYYPMRSLGG